MSENEDVDTIVARIMERRLRMNEVSRANRKKRESKNDGIRE